MKREKFVLLFATIVLSSLVHASDSTEVFAKRGNGEVTFAEFEAWISKIPERDRAPFLRDSKRLQQVLSQLLTVSQMAADANEAGFDDNPEVKARMAIAAETELAAAWIEHKMRTAAEPDFEQMAHEFFLANQGEFMTERAVDVTHLLISTEARSEEEALALAEQIKLKLDAGEASFEELIVEYSEDTSAATNKGQYKQVEKGDMTEPFEKRAFTLQIGEVSEPVKTEYGFHLIRLDDMHPSRVKDFEDVKPQLVLRARKQHEEQIRLDYLNQLGSYATDLPEDKLQEMVSRYFQDVEEPSEMDGDLE